jgi:hypothetical protein
MLLVALNSLLLFRERPHNIFLIALRKSLLKEAYMSGFSRLLLYCSILTALITCDVGSAHWQLEQWRHMTNFKFMINVPDQHKINANTTAANTPAALISLRKDVRVLLLSFFSPLIRLT